MMFKKLKDWHDEGLFGYYGAGWSDNQKPFEEDKVALWIGSSGSFGGLLKTAQMPFSATFLPYWKSIKGAGTNTFIGGAALFAMSGKPDAENTCTAILLRVPDLAGNPVFLAQVDRLCADHQGRL